LSSAIGSAMDLSTMFSTDFRFKPRPAAAWDIGAFQCAPNNAPTNSKSKKAHK
jgi:hypothetical protein